MEEMRSLSEDKELTAKRRRQILLAASGLFVKQGYGRTTVRQIAKSLGMSQGLIYNYVSSKQDIATLIMLHTSSTQDELFREITLAIEGLSSADGLCKAISMFCTWIEENEETILFASREILNATPEQRRFILQSSTEAIEFFEKLILKNIEAKGTTIEDSWLLAFRVVLAAEAWATRRWFLRSRWSLETYAANIGRSALREIARDDLHQLVVGSPKV